MIITCPQCFSADDVSYVKAPEAGFLYTCTRAKKHDPVGEWQWIADPKDPSLATEGWSDGGVTADLIEPFEAILRELPHQWIEYGVLEYALRLQYPEIFGRHVAERGHVLVAPSRATASSVRFATGLVRLERAAVVRTRLGPATGAWSYNSQVTHWMLKDASPGSPTLTWAQRCKDLERRPEWTDEDRATVRQLAIRYG